MGRSTRFLSIPVLILMAIALHAGGVRDIAEPPAASIAAGYPRTVEDSYGRAVIVADLPRRVISLGPNVTEIVYALGRGETLVGRTSWCDYPAAVKKLPVVGSLMEPNIEAIAALEPDLVIASTHFQRESLDLLEQLSIPVIVAYGPASFEGVYQTIGKIAEALDTEKAAEDLVDGMRERVARTERRVAGLPRPAVYYAIGYGEVGNYTAGGDTFIHQLLTMAGGRNIAADLEGWSYSVEKVVEGDPDLIICADDPGTAERLTRSPGFDQLEAVTAGRVYTVDIDLIDRQGPRLVDGLEALARIIHPEAFK